MERTVLVDPRGGRLDVEVPRSHRERMRGLLGRGAVPAGRGLLLEGARSVHTFGMRVPIAVVLLDGDRRVLGVRRLPPRRLLLPRRGVRHVLECATDVDLRPGDRLRLGGDRLGSKGDPATA